MHPFLWRFWTKIPSQGRIAIFDRSWYRRVLVDRFDGITTKEQLDYAFGEICSFEKQLTDDGMVIIKLFADVSKKELKKRFDKLLEDKNPSFPAFLHSWQDILHNAYFSPNRPREELQFLTEAGTGEC